MQKWPAGWDAVVCQPLKVLEASAIGAKLHFAATQSKGAASLYALVASEDNCEKKGLVIYYNRTTIRVTNVLR